jgi:hypothetical protein
MNAVLRLQEAALLMAAAAAALPEATPLHQVQEVMADRVAGTSNS